jgi:hypothetical protein
MAAYCTFAARSSITVRHLRPARKIGQRRHRLIPMRRMRRRRLPTHCRPRLHDNNRAPEQGEIALVVTAIIHLLAAALVFDLATICTTLTTSTSFLHTRFATQLAHYDSRPMSRDLLAILLLIGCVEWHPGPVDLPAHLMAVNTGELLRLVQELPVSTRLCVEWFDPADGETGTWKGTVTSKKPNNRRQVTRAVVYDQYYLDGKWEMFTNEKDANEEVIAADFPPTDYVTTKVVIVDEESPASMADVAPRPSSSGRPSRLNPMNWFASGAKADKDSIHQIIARAPVNTIIEVTWCNASNTAPAIWLGRLVDGPNSASKPRQMLYRFERSTVDGQSTLAPIAALDGSDRIFQFPDDHCTITKAVFADYERHHFTAFDEETRQKLLAASQPAPAAAASRPSSTTSVTAARPLPPAATTALPPAATGSDPWHDDTESPALTGYELDAKFIPTVRLIPRDDRQGFIGAIRTIVAGYRKLTTDNLAAKNAIWQEFLSFPKLHLRAAPDGAKKCAKKKHMKLQIAGSILASGPAPVKPVLSADESAVRRATKFARLGFVGKAATALSSTDTTFTGSIEERRNCLQTLHGREAPPNVMHLHSRMLNRTEDFVDQETLLKTSTSICSGSAPGPNGWTDELLRTALEDEECGKEILAMVRDIALNQVPAEAHLRLTSCRLFGITKSATALRPIAIGDAIVKLASVCMMRKYMPVIAPIFKGLQFGVGEKGGAEHIVHHARDNLEHGAANTVICTLDCMNAFNSVTRSAIVEAIRCHPNLRPLVPLFLFEYGNHSDLISDGFAIKSETGVRQGSVLGPLWFSLAIHAQLAQVHRRYSKKDVKIWMYLDDITLLGPVEAVRDAQEEITAELLKMGLRIHRGKCEWLSDAKDAPPLFKAPRAIKILGAYVGVDDAVVEKLAEVFKSQESFFKRLVLLPSDAACSILTICGVPKANYIIRTHDPKIAARFISSFDDHVTAAYSEIAEIDADDTTKAIAHLPVKMGGCGWTNMARTAKHAYDASREKAMNISRVSQKDRVLAENELLVTMLSKDKAVAAHLKSTSEAGTAPWLIDVSADENACASHFAAAARVRLRKAHRTLGARITCSGCKMVMDACEFHEHSGGCARLHGHNASSRHAAVKDEVDGIFHDARINFDVKEPREYQCVVCPGCHARLKHEAAKAHFDSCTEINSQQRTAGVPNARLTGPDGRCYIKKSKYVYDVTVISPTCKSYRDKPSGEGIKRRSNEKHRLYDDQVEAHGETLVILGATMFGHLSDESMNFLGHVCKNPGSSITVDEAAKRLSVCIALSTGRIIHDAEQRAGAIHRQQANETAIDMKTNKPFPRASSQQQTVSTSAPAPTASSNPTGRAAAQQSSASDTASSQATTASSNNTGHASQQRLAGPVGV